MSLKFSNIVSAFILSITLTLSVTSSCKASLDFENLSVEMRIPIVRAVSIMNVDCGVLGMKDIVDMKTLCTFRQLSNLWKDAADDVMLRDKLLSICLRPDNILHPGLDGIAPLVTKIYLSQWNMENSSQIALCQQVFANVLEINCFSSGGATLISKDIGENGMIALASILPHFSKLQRLSISVRIGERGGEALGKALPCLTDLIEISLNGTCMGPIGTMQFAEGLSHKKLESLSLYANGVGDIGCVALANKLEKLPSLKSICMTTVFVKTPGGDSCYIKEAGESYFKMMANKHNPKLVYSLKD